MPRHVLDSTVTPEGESLELALEGEHYVIRVAGLPLMSSGAHGSERAMARVAREVLGQRPAPRVLVGGLGMGYTLRAALDAFGPHATVTVAELLPCVVGYNRGPLGPLAGHPLRDGRVQVFEGDVRDALGDESWEVVLLDVDNGPFAFTAHSNDALYAPGGIGQLARALTPSGVLVVWSAYPSERFAGALRAAGLRTEVRTVSAHDQALQPGDHTLFVAQRATDGAAPT